MKILLTNSILAASLLAPSTLLSQQSGGVGDSCAEDQDCDTGLVCVDEHYVYVSGEWMKEPQACARADAANQAKFVEAPLDLGTFTVTARRIVPPTFRIFQWSPSTPVYSPPLTPPFAPPPPPEEEEDSYSFGTCSRMLGGSYWQPSPNMPNWVQEAVQGWIERNPLRHDDVIWGPNDDSSLGAAYQGAGLFPALAYEDQARTPQVIIHLSASSGLPLPSAPVIDVTFPTVPGRIKSLSPIPSVCTTFDMNEQQHHNVSNRVDSFRANPPDYNLLGFDQCGTGYNCQDWAQEIENVALGR